MRAHGVRASSRVLDTALREADRDVARALDLPPGGAVAMIRRLRMADGMPLIVEVCHLAHRHTPNVLGHDLSGSLYGVLEREYGVRLVLGWETLEVWRADPEIARTLGLPERSDVLFTERLAIGESATGIEFTRRYARADRCRFRIELTGGSADVTLRR